VEIPFERSEKVFVFIYINPKNSASWYPDGNFFSRRSRRCFFHADRADIIFTQISQMDSHRSHRWIHADYADILFTQSRW